MRFPRGGKLLTIAVTLGVGLLILVTDEQGSQQRITSGSPELLYDAISIRVDGERYEGARRTNGIDDLRSPRSPQRPRDPIASRRLLSQPEQVKVAPTSTRALLQDNLPTNFEKADHTDLYTARRDRDVAWIHARNDISSAISADLVEDTSEQAVHRTEANI
eukprot:3067038-Pyramimonas_sp.AAC.2